MAFTSENPKKIPKVENKTLAEMREATERDLKILPEQKIYGCEKLSDYQLRERRNIFENNIQKNTTDTRNWIKYAEWEENQKQIQIARLVYERALDVNPRSISLWLEYGEIEMRNRHVKHARNIWDRAITILPRTNQFWYKYTHMEENFGSNTRARQVFERWLQWKPNEEAWFTNINFELRYNEIDRARKIHQRFVLIYPDVKNWIKYAKFEEQHGYITNGRFVFEGAVEFFGEEHMDEELFVAFAKFEERQKEHDRVRNIFKYALKHIPKEKSRELFKNYMIHEKKYGVGIEDSIISQKKFQYEEKIKANPSNYDVWLDYLRLIESVGNIAAIREVYERAVANVPPMKEKRYWRRYIYLWINYALFEERIAEDEERTYKVYNACFDLIPYTKFTEREDRLMLLEAWQSFEIAHDDYESQVEDEAAQPNSYPNSQLLATAKK
uniref:Pre-mRNA-splicing factor Syf1/CRNKL1-like C-terminal HAT-repeats domain-containing protein n=1 Tax=Strigamia maritima TaxID=126957 RepID=T1IWJ5_STRMM